MKEKLYKKSAKNILLLLSFICMVKISISQVKQPDEKLFFQILQKASISVIMKSIGLLRISCSVNLYMTKYGESIKLAFKPSGCRLHLTIF